MKMFRQPSVNNAQQHFSNVPSADIERSTFDRSHAYKTTFDAGDLIPVFVDEVLPGDTFNITQTGFARLATPLKPIMDNIYIDTHFFFVPNRLVWDKWQEFCGERKSPTDDPSDIVMPIARINLENSGGRLSDYFGLPNRPVTTEVDVNPLPFRAYALIWNEWYRDGNLQEPVVFNTDSTTDYGNPFPLKRGKRKDYFTSCLPWPQAGDPVVIPLGNYAPVHGIGAFAGSTVFGTAGALANETGGTQTTYVNSATSSNASQSFLLQEDPARPGYPMVWADLGDATTVSINDLRSAFQIQKLLERDARGGSRYIELVLAHFGVRSPDARLQRPEYLGGESTPVNIHPVASTFAAVDIPQGELAGVGTALTRLHVEKSFTEHGYVIGLASARADLTYQEGIERMWSRKTRYDFYWPALSHLGEQAVLMKEIYAVGAAGGVQDDSVFGYQERYAEYRYKPSRVTGKFNSGNADSLDVWHLAQDFTSPPPLNESFIVENPPLDRVIAVPTEPHFLYDVWFNFKCTRPMPVYSVPGLIDHF